MKQVIGRMLNEMFNDGAHEFRRERNVGAYLMQSPTATRLTDAITTTTLFTGLILEFPSVSGMAVSR